MHSASDHKILATWLALLGLAFDDLGDAHVEITWDAGGESGDLQYGDSGGWAYPARFRVEGREIHWSMPDEEE